MALEDNNDSMSFYGGAMMHCCEGKACCVAMLHAGPEDPRNNRDGRYLSDIVTTWKITDKLTSINDINQFMKSQLAQRDMASRSIRPTQSMIAAR